MKRTRKVSIAVNTRFLLPHRLEGIGYFTAETLKRIVKNHPEIDFYFLFDRKYSEEFIFAENVTPIILPPPARHPLLWFLWFEISVSHWLNKHKPDLFLSPDSYGCLRTNIPQVIVMHDLAFEHFPEHIPFLTRIYYKYYMPKFARKAKLLATVSEFSKKDIIDKYHIPPETIRVVYSGVKEIYVPGTDDLKTNVKKQYAEGKNYFLYSGSIHPRKNVARLLLAFDRFKSETGSDMKFVITGKKSWDFGDVEEIYAKMEFRNDVRFTGYLSDKELASVTASAACMLFVSLFEGFGVPILEAMKCEVPVITSNSSSMPEIAGDAALLVNPALVNEIVDAMKRVAADSNLLQSLIEKGTKQAQLFSWDSTAEKLWECCNFF